MESFKIEFSGTRERSQRVVNVLVDIARLPGESRAS